MNIKKLLMFAFISLLSGITTISLAVSNTQGFIGGTIYNKNKMKNELELDKSRSTCLPYFKDHKEKKPIPNQIRRNGKAPYAIITESCVLVYKFRNDTAGCMINFTCSGGIGSDHCSVNATASDPSFTCEVSEIYNVIIK